MAETIKEVYVHSEHEGKGDKDPDVYVFANLNEEDKETAKPYSLMNVADIESDFKKEQAFRGSLRLMKGMLSDTDQELVKDQINKIKDFLKQGFAEVSVGDKIYYIVQEKADEAPSIRGLFKNARAAEAIQEELQERYKKKPDYLENSGGKIISCKFNVYATVLEPNIETAIKNNQEKVACKHKDKRAKKIIRELDLIPKDVLKYLDID